MDALHAIACAIIAMAGASFSAIDQRTSMYSTFWHLGMAGSLGAFINLTQKGLWPSYSWYVCSIPAFLVGFCVYGIAIGLKRSSKTAEGINLVNELRRRLTKGQ